MKVEQEQLDKFKHAARAHKAGEDESQWHEWLKTIAKVRPALEKPE